MKKGFYLMMLVGFCSLIGCKDYSSFLPWHHKKVIDADVKSNVGPYIDSVQNSLDELKKRRSEARMRFREVREEVLYEFRKMEGLNPSLNPSNAPKYYFTATEADKLNGLESIVAVEGTPNWLVITQEFNDGIHLFSKANRKIYGIEEADYLDLKKRVFVASAKVFAYDDLIGFLKADNEIFVQEYDAFTIPKMLNRTIEQRNKVQVKVSKLFGEFQNFANDLNPNQAPIYFFTQAEADRVGNPDLAGTPKYQRIMYDLENELNMFREDFLATLAEENDELQAEVISLRDELLIVNGFLEDISSIYDAAEVTVNKNIGEHLDYLKISKSNPWFFKRHIELSTGKITWNDDRQLFKFLPSFNKSKDDFDDHQYSMLPSFSSRKLGEAYYLTRGQALRFLVCENSEVVLEESFWNSWLWIIIVLLTYLFFALYILFHIFSVLVEIIENFRERFRKKKTSS